MAPGCPNGDESQANTQIDAARLDKKGFLAKSKQGGDKMKKTILGIIFLALIIVVPVPTMAGVDISIGISLPSPIVFEGPPVVVVIPDTSDVYAVPDVMVEIYFWNGWWWRPWQGRWYRSQYYDRGWVYYRNVPWFYYDVDPYWREHYRDHNWYGHKWHYKRIPYQKLQYNWKGWQDDRYWEKHGNWGVRNYEPRPPQQKQELRQQRQRQYEQRPDVQRYQHQEREQQKQHQQPRHQEPQSQKYNQPSVHQPQKNDQYRQQNPQSQGKQHQENPQQQQSQGKPGKGDSKHNK
jgi:hypothetical protein